MRNPPHWQMLLGDARTRLADVPSESCRMCVTSPPYWGLRDYDADEQIGLEQSPDEWLQVLVELFRQVRRVLTKDGTLWVNIGDAWAESGRGGNPNAESSTLQGSLDSQAASMVKRGRKRPAEYKPKDMLCLPWLLGLALRADGWYLREAIIWHKPNPMPESAKDRCTKAHEYILHLSKSRRYYHDWNAIAEPCSENTHLRVPKGWATGPGSHDTLDHNRVGRRAEGHGRPDGNHRKMPPIGGKKHLADGNRTRIGNTPNYQVKNNESFANATAGQVLIRNARSVWTFPTKGTSEDHYATFPEELPRRCIAAGSKPGDVVLDPFSGIGTTGIVALKMGRSFVGVELNPKWHARSRERLGETAPLTAVERVEVPA